ncbi:MAG TPA: hypothetical protein DD979_12265 [Gammaproteobacteria bacterium]|jgi:hypothetical protein|nr:hypothetical protein [Gammaproteobacteria bacterium]
MPKLIFLLLTWPVGLYVIPKIVKAGFSQSPYALAVHEMLIIAVLSILMISSVLFAALRKRYVASPWRHTLSYALKVCAAAGLSYLFAAAPLATVVVADETVARVGLQALLALIVAIGIWSAYRGAAATRGR